jgi:hypothetical protein
LVNGFLRAKFGAQCDNLRRAGQGLNKELTPCSRYRSHTDS